MALDYGVIPWQMALPENPAELLSILEKLIQDQKWAQAGDSIIVVTGHPLGTPATTDTIHLHLLG